MSLKYAASLGAGALIALFGTGVAAQTVDGPAVNWNLSTWGKQRAFTAGMESVAKQLADRTGGKFQIKIHYGEADARGIIGQASFADLRDLLEEGIEVAPLPVLPEDAN